jgi:AcrR family transcriptional regulator
MKRDAKDEMIEGVLRLLAQHGLQASSFSEVLTLTGAPRGSIYHHFPKGKEELVAAALKLSEERTTTVIESLVGGSPEAITSTFKLYCWLFGGGGNGRNGLPTAAGTGNGYFSFVAEGTSSSINQCGAFRTCRK